MVFWARETCAYNCGHLHPFQCGIGTELNIGESCNRTANFPEPYKPMSLSLTPGALYGLSPRVSPAGGAPVRPQTTAAQATEDGETVNRAARRSADYVAALRELKAQGQDMRHNQASRTYLDIAHLDGGFQLIDVYA